MFNNSNTFDNVTALPLDHRVLTEKCQYYFSSVRSLTLSAPKNDHNRLFTTQQIQYLKRIVSLFTIKHLDVQKKCQMESSLILLEILKEALQLSSMAINGKTLKLFFKNRELCTYLNKRIKKLYLHVDNDCFFNNDYESQEFCEIFSNLEHLERFGCASADLIFLVSSLSKLSSAKVVSAASFGSENHFSRR